jgi:hypothetical protein
MSHVPPSKCWTCARPMTGDMVATSRIECEVCGFHSCGVCVLRHYRKAHPAAFMKNFMTAIYKQNKEHSDTIARLPLVPVVGNVIPFPVP